LDHLIVDLLAKDTVVVLSGEQIRSGNALGIADTHEKPNFHITSVINSRKAEKFRARSGGVAVIRPLQDNLDTARWFFCERRSNRTRSGRNPKVPFRARRAFALHRPYRRGRRPQAARQASAAH